MIRVVSFTEAGGHPENEDAFLVRPHPRDPACLLCALADGQGGRAGGGPAARLACRTGVDLASEFAPGELADLDRWLEIVCQVDQVVHRDGAAGLTTLVAFAVRGDQLVGASSGDSAAVVLCAGRPAQVVTAGQLKNPPVGSGDAAVRPLAATLRRPWAVLAMSDGVWKYGGMERILSLDPRADGDAILSGLQGRARLPGTGEFQDDFTVVLLQDGEADERSA